MLGGFLSVVVVVVENILECGNIHMPNYDYVEIVRKFEESSVWFWCTSTRSRV